MSKAILVHLDDSLAAELDKAVPAKSRRRAEFVRRAIRKALMALQEIKTAEAYRRIPDKRSVYYDPRVWDPEPWPKPRRRRR